MVNENADNEETTGQRASALAAAEKAAAKAFVDQMLAVTVPLIADVHNFPTCARGSGVLLQRGRDYLLLTAGHLFKPGRLWSLETPIKAKDGCLHVGLHDLQLFAQIDLADGSSEPIDIATAWIRVDDLRAACQHQQVISTDSELCVYDGPLDVPADADEIYGFASYSRAAFDPRDRALLRESAYELGMRLRSRDPSSGLLIFDLAREHMGDAYYEGASGSPIADSTGRIVGLLLGAGGEPNTLRALEPARFGSILDLAV